MPADPRIEEYAKLLVEECVDVQPGWQVLVNSQPLGRPLVDEVCRQIALGGAYAIPRLSFSFAGNEPWIKAAPEELLGELPSIEVYTIENATASSQSWRPKTRATGRTSPRSACSSCRPPAART
jgi:leucyl aminopeptidase (aminopeptidase T)